MPRLLNRYFIFLLFAVGAPNPVDCQAHPIDPSTNAYYGDLNQTEIASDSADNKPTITPDDSTLITADTAVSDTVILEPVLYISGEDSSLISLYQSQETSKGTVDSPTVNLFKSVVFPGWGQYCNRKYIKAGVIFAVESYFIYKAVDNGRQASDWHARFQEAPTDLKETYFSEYSGYRDRRNTFLWYTALTVFLSMFDAYVDAHLQNFPKNASGAENLSVEAGPGGETRLTLRYNF